MFAVNRYELHTNYMVSEYILKNLSCIGGCEDTVNKGCSLVYTPTTIMPSEASIKSLIHE